VRELARLGHDVLFLERDVPWYAANRDAPFAFGRTALYSSIEDLQARFEIDVRTADFVMVGSYVPDGIAVGRWILKTAEGATGFYDIDTPVTLARLARGNGQYIAREMIADYGLYLSFTGGPILEKLAKDYGASMPRAFYCSFDPELYRPGEKEASWELGYMGTYSKDRQPALDALMLEPARRWPAGRFTVAGPLYPGELQWPANVSRVDHVNPLKHRDFYLAQKFTLNITRADMVRAGYSPSVRLFEAAGCGVPIISDYWEGIEDFFDIGPEILISRSADQTLEYIRDLPQAERLAIGERARRRALAGHTAAHRARELVGYIAELKKM
jgi:spore maturation protein CgeB